MSRHGTNETKRLKVCVDACGVPTMRPCHSSKLRTDRGPGTDCATGPSAVVTREAEEGLVGCHL